MLGTEMCATAPIGTSVVALDVADADITDRDQVASALRNARPDWVINTAAYTAVDRAEIERETADAVNGLAPRYIAEESARLGIAIVHLSTDYVFPGTATKPYEEGDPVAPVNAYGVSKLRGEEGVLSSKAHSLVVRTQWLFGRGGPSFPRTMWERAAAGLPTSVVDDQVGRPTYAGDLAVAIWRLVERRASGIVHAASGGPAVTWFQFAREVFVRARAEALLSPCTTEEYPTPSRRPAYSVLSTHRLESLLSGPLPDWRDRLRRFLHELTLPSR